MTLVTPEMIERLLPRYWRWEVEGRRPYMHNHRDDRSPQFYYDPYHYHIRYREDGTYEFDIQIDGAPEGDTWVRGIFVLEGNSVLIIEQKAYFN